MIALDIARLDAADGHDACGGKAANLARIARQGLRIPDGVVVGGSFLEQHLARSRLGPAVEALDLALDSADDTQWRARAAALRDQVIAAPLAPELAATLAELCTRRWPGRALAVRSSAVGEDSLRDSFAGQLDSFLGVGDATAAADAVRRVWASLWSERCLAYQRRRGVRLRALGVVVCEQIDARFSGVLFTRAPDDPTRMLAECCAGLGDRLVAGDVTPGSVYFDRPSGAIVAARLPHGALPPGILEFRGQLAALATGALALERTFGSALDIEWTIGADGVLVFLQARPITGGTGGTGGTAGIGPERVVWTNANIAENYPDPVSPMLYSIARRGYTAYFENLGRGFGISRRRLAAMRDPLEQVVGVHAGRLYYNLTNIHSLLHLAPGGRWLARFFNEFTGAEDFPAPRASVRLGRVERLLEPVRVTARVLGQYAGVRRRVARFEATVDAYCARHPREALAGSSLESLRDALAGFMDIRLRRWNDAALADTAAMVAFGVLRLVLARGLPAEAGGALHTSLLRGLADLASNRPVLELWKLSRRVRSDPALRTLLERAAPEEFLEALARPGHAAFATAFREYLERYGFRGSRELMLTAATPAERPAEALELLGTYAAVDGPSPEELLERQTAERTRSTAEIERRLTPWSWWRRVPLASRAARFRLVLAAAQGAIRLRERARFRQAHLYTRLRQVLLAIGERLRARGLLDQRDDVFFLAVDELDLLLAGSEMFHGTVAEVARARRQAHARFAAMDPPDTLRLPAGEYFEHDPAQRAAPAAGPAAGTATTRLHGTGACGGRFQGPAAVLADSREAHRLTAGALLVTRQTDPGWASVFFLARGLVVERGGLLSHGAIIAREYGIPAVVGVPGATTRIREGDEVSVDGDHGVVELLCR